MWSVAGFEATLAIRRAINWAQCELARLARVLAATAVAVVVVAAAAAVIATNALAVALPHCVPNLALSNELVWSHRCATRCRLESQLAAPLAAVDGELARSELASGLKATSGAGEWELPESPYMTGVLSLALSMLSTGALRTYVVLHDRPRWSRREKASGGRVHARSIVRVEHVVRILRTSGPSETCGERVKEWFDAEAARGQRESGGRKAQSV